MHLQDLQQNPAQAGRGQLVQGEDQGQGPSLPHQEKFEKENCRPLQEDYHLVNTFDTDVW